MVVRYPRLSMSVVYDEDTVYTDTTTTSVPYTIHIIVIRIIYNYNYRSAVTTTTVCNSYTGVLVYLY